MTSCFNILASMRRPGPARRKRVGGFSLLELLAAVTILMIMVIMMTVVFTESDRSWTIGTNRVDNNASGRAALTMLVHDLQYAVADDILSFRMFADPANKTYGYTNSELRFVSIQHDSSDVPPTRAAREIYYLVLPMTNSVSSDLKRYQLVRGYYASEISDPLTRNLHCYGTNTWSAGTNRPPNAGVIAENVTAFGVYYTNGIRNYYSADPIWLADSDHSNRVPKSVDIFIEILNERPSRQVADLWRRGGGVDGDPSTDRANDMIEKNARRYTTRVYFNNRDGYKVR